MRRLILLVIPQLLAAQALKIAPSTAARGETGSLLIRLEAPLRGGPASLQWDLVVSKQVAVNVHDIFPGSSAESAGKSLYCVPGAARRDDLLYRCMLAGGVETIRNGPVAIVRYKVSQRAHGQVLVRLEKALGASKDVTRIEYPNAQGEITIR